jgi:hypothetical protein
VDAFVATFLAFDNFLCSHNDSAESFTSIVWALDAEMFASSELSLLCDFIDG